MLVVYLIGVGSLFMKWLPRINSPGVNLDHLLEPAHDADGGVEKSKVGHSAE
jgi:hypothetical protein